MNDEIPYDAPKVAAVARSTHLASLLWSVIAVFGCACVGGVLGLGIGVALGAFVPGYYRSVFRSGADAHFDPIAVGIGQGLTQGVAFGGIIGLVLVALWYWHQSRRNWRDRNGSVGAG